MLYIPVLLEVNSDSDADAEEALKAYTDPAVASESVRVVRVMDATLNEPWFTALLPGQMTQVVAPLVVEP